MCRLTLSSNTDKMCLKSNMLIISIKVIAFGSRPENGPIHLIVQWYIL